MKRYVVEQLDAIYRKHALDRIVVLTPTRQVGRNLQGWLADSGTPHGNIRFADVALFAHEQVEADTNRALPEYASHDLLALAAADAIAAASAAPDFYFGDATGAGFVRIVERTMATLREAGITPDMLSGSPRVASVGRLLEAFGRKLRTMGLVDDADVFHLATDYISRRGGHVGVDVLCVLDEVRLNVASEQMVRALAPRYRYRLGLETYEHEPPERTAARRLTDWPRATGVAPDGAFDGAFDGGLPQLRVVTAPSPEREIEGILADILEGGLRWDQCELAYTTGDYLSTIESVADALGIPCAFAAGRPVTGTAPGQALVQFYRTFEPAGESFAEVVDAGVRFLDSVSETRTERDRAASTSLKDRLLVLAQSEYASKVGLPADSAAALLADLVGDHHYETSAAREGALYAVPLDGSGYAGREHTFIVGLDEHVFPGSTHEDPILLDHDRTAISVGLPLRHGDAGARIWSLDRALRAGGTSTTLVGRDLDLIYGKHIALSPAIVALLDRHALRTESYGLVESAERSLSEGAMLLSQRNTTGYGELVSDVYPWMAQGQQAARLRDGVAMNEYCGFLGRATPELSVRGDAVFSPSALERLTSCPYRHFLSRVLQIRKPDEPALEPGQWLDSREFGVLFHELLYRLMSRLRESGERADADHHAGLAAELLDQVVAEKEAERPPPGPAAREHDRRRLERSALIFLRNESRVTTEPVEFELNFGQGEEGPLEVALDADMTLRLRGTIDRVDRADDGYEVWDYKSGSTAAFSDEDLATTTGHLQWMLYAYAFEDVRTPDEPDARVVRSGYLFVNDREHGRRLVAPVREREQLARDLRPLAVLTEAGAFPHYQKGSAGRGTGPKGACKFCDYNEICWKERRTRKDMEALAKSDRESPVGEALEAWLS